MPIKTIALAMASAVVAGIASAEVYYCTFKVPGGNGFVPREVLVEFKSASDAQITDGLSNYMEQAPVAAKFAQNTDQRIRARWSVTGAPSSGGFKVDIDYALAFNKRKGRADVTMNIRGFDNTDSGNGTCEKVD